MDELSHIARQAIAVGLDLVRWDQELDDLRGDAEGEHDAEADKNGAKYQESRTQCE